MKSGKCKIVAVSLLLSLAFFGCLQGTPIGSALVMIDNTGTVTSQFRQGAQVTFIIVMANTTDHEQELLFPTTKKYDVAVFDQNQNLVWSWGYGLDFNPTPSEMSFDPYGVKIFGVFWNQSSILSDQVVSPGVYTVYVVNPSGGNFAGPYSITIKES